MPHSSGGGSHSGGGGGGHSSGGGSHSGSGGGGRSYVGIKTTPYSGASTYVRYNSDHTLSYIYSDINPKTQKATSIILLIFFTLIYGTFFMAGFWMLKDTLIIPHKMSVYDSCMVEDNLDLFTPEEEIQLKETLNDFQIKTGIPVYLVTDDNHVWNMNYSTLSNYAFDWYVNRISDEAHWVIFYTTDLNDDFDPWFYEGMQGDNTDDILNDRILSEFNGNLRKYLYTRNQYTISNAFITAFEDIQPDLMKWALPPFNQIVFPLIWLTFTSGHCILIVGSAIKSGQLTLNFDKYKGYVKCPESHEEALCEYCGTPYVVGTIRKCPSCGAPTKIKSIKEASGSH